MEIHGSEKAPEFKDNFDPTEVCSFRVFLKLFPSQWLKDVVLDQTKKRFDRELTWGEFLHYLGLWFLMSSVGGGFKKKDFWNTIPFEE